MGAYSTVTYNTLTLNVVRITPVKVPATRKQVIGKNIVKISIPGLDGYEYELQIDGIIIGTSKDTDRDSLLAAEDATYHAYVDGKHDGNYYIVPGSLQFSDDGTETHSIYRYSMSLIQA